MKILYCIFLFLPVFTLCQYPNQDNNKISAGSRDAIHSSILNEERQLWVHVPASLTAGSQNRYPVMYLLDGPSFFYPVTGMVQYLSSVGKMPEMIVVGIANTKRVRDLTPTHSISWSDGERDTAALGSSGGGENFLAFIQNELIPHIDSAYKTAPYRMFVGHSLGGLTVLNALINHPALFTSYVAIDPSVWWDKQTLMNKSAQIFINSDFSGKSLYFASANTMDKDMDTVRVVKDTAHGNVHVRDNLHFREILRNSQKNHLQWNWKYYPEDNHTSIPLIASYDALRSLFKVYELGKDLNDTTITITDIKMHYDNVSAQLHYTVLPSESMVNLLGYNFLSATSYDKAYGLFKMNIENYPFSANAYDSMGDFYIEKNDRKKAIGMFKKALSLKELPETRKKLIQLEAKE